MLAASYSASCRQAVKISGTAPSYEHNDQIYCVNEYMMHTCAIRQKPSTNTRSHIQAHIKRNTQTGSQTLSTNLRVSHVKLLFFLPSSVSLTVPPRRYVFACDMTKLCREIRRRLPALTSSSVFIFFLPARKRYVCLKQTRQTHLRTYPN